jgi:hypothetical protein
MLEPHKIKGLPKLTHFIYRILIIDLERVLTLRITSKNIAIVFVKNIVNLIVYMLYCIVQQCKVHNTQKQAVGFVQVIRGFP